MVLQPGGEPAVPADPRKRQGFIPRWPDPADKRSPRWRLWKPAAQTQSHPRGAGGSFRAGTASHTPPRNASPLAGSWLAPTCGVRHGLPAVLAMPAGEPGTEAAAQADSRASSETLRRRSPWKALRPALPASSHSRVRPQSEKSLTEGLAGRSIVCRDEITSVGLGSLQDEGRGLRTVICYPDPQTRCVLPAAGLLVTFVF